MRPPLDIAVVGLRHPHAVRGHEPVGWTDTLSYVPELRVAAVCDSTAQGRAAAALHLPGVPMFSDIQQLLHAHPEVRAALVLLPNNEMGAALTELTAAGIHVALDKPGARRSEELKPALEHVRDRGLVSAVAYLWRLKPIGEDMRRLAEDGRIGRLLAVDGRSIATTVAVRGATSPLFQRESSGGGILHWLGCHWLDLIRFVTQSDVDQVTAATANVGGENIDVEDYASVTMELANGAVANLVTGYLLPAGHRADLALRGRKGWVEADMTGDTIRTSLENIHRAGSDATPGNMQHSDPPTVHGYGGKAGVDFLLAFGRAVAERTQTDVREYRAAPGLATLEDAARTLALVEAAYASAENGGPVAPAHP